MARVVIVPGLAVRTYALPAAQAAARAGFTVSLLRAPAWRGAPANVVAYGERLAQDLEVREDATDVLVGLSVGTQAAAVASCISARVGHLLLVSPTVDPSIRSAPRLLGRWLHGEPGDDAPGWSIQLPDWAHAGAPRIAQGFASALRTPLEDVLPGSSARLTIVHAEHDSLGSRGWARRLASDNGGRLVDAPGAPHSWPVGDTAGFVELLREVTA